MCLANSRYVHSRSVKPSCWRAMLGRAKHGVPDSLAASPYKITSIYKGILWPYCWSVMLGRACVGLAGRPCPPRVCVCAVLSAHLLLCLLFISQALLLERDAWAGHAWDWQAGLALLGFALSLFCFSLLLPSVLMLGGSAVLNLSLLTSDLWAAGARCARAFRSSLIERANV
jgi:hypothetical protein